MSESIKQPEALRLADTPFALRDGRWNFDADDELRRLHVEVERLRAELARMVRRAEQSKAHRDEVGAELTRLTTLPCSAAHAPPPPPPPLWSKGCPVCGLSASGTATGYVCQRGDCPARVTCEVTK